MPERKLYLGPLTDNRRWDAVTLRAGDVIVVTPPKAGTTWMQTIIALLFAGDPQIEPDFSIKMPWIDFRMREIEEVAARMESMSGRRCMKSHTPVDGVPLHDKAQYLCVFRHPLDIHFSFRHHVRNVPISLFDAWYPENDKAGLAFRRFLDGGPEGYDGDLTPLAHILRHYKAAKALERRANVTLLHYADMKRDLRSVFIQVSDQINARHPEPVLVQLIDAARFDSMKRNADRFAPSGGKGFFKSDAAFFHSGTCGKWQGALTEAEIAAYDDMMDAHLSPSERAWLEFGSKGAAV